MEENKKEQKELTPFEKYCALQLSNKNKKQEKKNNREIYGSEMRIKKDKK